MRKLIYSMNVTLDGYIAARGHDIGWGVPSAPGSGAATDAFGRGIATAEQQS